ncbi:MAG: endonuclease, partial [Taibaiella sp.]|nr:endonuclease [Taibaiella sp.]
NAYYTTDVKPNGKLWDMYSDIPGGTPAYEYTIGADQCGSTSPSAEGGCYNREHTWPQSKFASDTPMQNDLFIVIPTDYYVNNLRGNLPYGKVGGTPTHVFTNGGKIGGNGYAGAPSGSCFEPIDSFKGDLARTYFYIATCYYGADSTKFTNWEMATGISFKPWAIAMLLEWHHNDPVSAKEINRNNKAYLRQNNRNPFIDYPEYADCIWGSGPCTNAVDDVPAAQQSVTVITNDAAQAITLDWHTLNTGELTGISLYNLNGQVVYTTRVAENNTPALSISTATMAKGIYLLRLNSLHNAEVRKIVVQ